MQATLEKTKTPLHLRLTNFDWIDCFKELSRAELGVFYYIRTLDPYGDRGLDIDCSEVAELLGIHRTSVSRALEELSKKGLIDLEIAKARVRQKINNRRLTLLTTQDNQSKSQQIEENETCAPTQIAVHPCTVPCADAQPCAPTQINVHPCTVPCADAQGHNIDRARANTLSNSSKLDLKTTNKSVVGSKEIDLENEPEGSYQADEEIFAQLRKLGIKLNTTVRKIVTSHRPNVSDAIAHLQERVFSGESFKCLEAAFVTACKEASKPERINAPPVELPQPDPSHLELLETAKRNGSISGYYSSPYKGGITMLVDDCINRRAMAWWEYLQLNEELEEVEF